jgi:hypothetical protein
MAQQSLQSFFGPSSKKKKKAKIACIPPAKAKQLLKSKDLTVAEKKVIKKNTCPIIKKDFHHGDLNFETAVNAYRNTSWSPEERAIEEQKEYVNHMERIKKDLTRYVRNEEQGKILEKEIEKYRLAYLSKKHALLHRRAGIASPMITGPSRFPTERMRKKNEMDHRKTGEFIDWKKKAKTAIKRKITGATTAAEELSDLKIDIIDDLKQAAFKKYKDGEKAPSYIRTNAKARIMGKLTTLAVNGQIKELEQMLDMITVKQKSGPTIFTNRHKIWLLLEGAKRLKEKKAARKISGITNMFSFTGGKVVNNHNDERIQILFDDKPSAKVRSDLKSSGWRWSPRNSAWQRKNTRNAEYSVKEIIKGNYQVV